MSVICRKLNSWRIDDVISFGVIVTNIGGGGGVFDVVRDDTDVSDDVPEIPGVSGVAGVPGIAGIGGIGGIDGIPSSGGDAGEDDVSPDCWRINGSDCDGAAFLGSFTL